MSIEMYHDSAAAEPITENDPDFLRQAVESGETMENIKPLYLESDDTTLEYENVSVEKIESEMNEIHVDYAESEADFDTIDAGTQENLSLSNGDYDTIVEIFRRVTAQNVTEAFKRDDIYHRVNFDEYVK